MPINISVSIDEKGITASPAKFGAGPITLLVANQSGASQTLTIDGPRLRRSVGPINPQDTATVRLRVQPGELHALRRGVGRPARGDADGRAASAPARRTTCCFPSRDQRHQVDRHSVLRPRRVTDFT